MWNWNSLLLIRTPSLSEGLRDVLRRHPLTQDFGGPEHIFTTAFLFHFLHVCAGGISTILPVWWQQQIPSDRDAFRTLRRRRRWQLQFAELIAG
jgi:hypothetical protein